MPPVVGILLSLFGVWFIHKALQRRRSVLALRDQQAAVDTAQEEASTDEEPAAKSGPSLQEFASGCAPVFAFGIVLMAVAVAGIAVLMDGLNRISIFDILGLLFFAGAYAFSMMMRTYYNSGGGSSD